MIKKRFMLTCTLVLLLCLAGCGLFQSDTTQLKGLLEDKYGEEFGVESYYYAGDMWAICYPVSDPTLLFEVRTDGSVTKISHDYYLQTVVARQVEEEYGPLVQQAFPGSYLSVDISNTLASVPDNFPKADEVTLDDITQYCVERDLSSDIVFNIFVNTSQMTEVNIESEYRFLSEDIGGRVKDGTLPDTIVKLYFGDAVFIKECEDILKKMSWRGSSDIYDIIKESKQLWIWYYEFGTPELSMNQGELTLEKYLEKRAEVLNNE